MFLVLRVVFDDLFLHFIQGGTVILSGPGGPAVASVTPQTSELVGEVVHDPLLIHLLFVLGCHSLSHSITFFYLFLLVIMFSFFLLLVYVSALVQ